MNPDSTVVFVGIDEARRVLTHRDDFMAVLSKFDRAARMKTDQEATEAEFLGFVRGSGLSWSVAESNRLTRVFQNVADKLTGTFRCGA